MLFAISACAAVHQKDVAAVAVAGHMQCQFLVCLHDSSAQVQVIDHLRDSTLVADNRIAAEDHRVPFLHFDVAVRAETHAGKACRLFTLASRSDDERFAVGNLVHARAHFAYQPAWGFQVAQILGDLGIGLHASAGDKHFAVISLGVLHDLLDAVQKRRECRDDHAAFGIADLSLSLLLKPGFVAFVESAMIASTPSLPSSARRWKSAGGSSPAGVRSNLKSPVWTIFPYGVWRTIAAESGILCVTRRYSTSTLPMRIFWP